MARLTASIDSNALKHNLELVKAKAPKSKVVAMVKANAYGHGLLEAAHALIDADAFGVATLQEAIALRDDGIKNKIILMAGVYTDKELQDAAEYNIDLVVHCPFQVELLKDSKFSMKVWPKINTGFNRLGFKPEEFPSVVDALRSQNCEIEAVMTHFAKANEQDAESLKQQSNIFLDAVASFKYPISLANSAAIFMDETTHADWVRPGIALYGVSPFANKTGEDLGLHAALALQSRLMSIYYVKAGEKIGYGWHYVAKKDMRVGIISIGYGDGYMWTNTKNPPVFYKGKQTSIVGQTAMDMSAIDLTDIEDAKVGDYVSIWSKDLPVEKVAASLQTSAYALLTSLSTQTERVLRTTLI